MSPADKTTPLRSPFKVAVKLDGEKAEPKSFSYTDKEGGIHPAEPREGNSLARAVALILALYRRLDAPILFRASTKSQPTKKSRHSNTSRSRPLKAANPIVLILNSHKEISKSLSGMYGMGGTGEDNLLKLFKRARGVAQPSLEFDTTRCSPNEICVEWDGNVITDSAKLKELAATIAANANPPWEIADYIFEPDEPATPDIVAAASASPAAQEPTIPQKIRKLLDQAEKLTERDEYADAVPILEKALEAAIRAKHDTAEAKAHRCLAQALFQANEDYAASENHYRKALEILGTKASINRHSLLRGLGEMLLAAGRMDEAGAVIHSGLDVARSLGDQDCVALSLTSLSLLERRIGKGIEAVARLDEAIRILNQRSIGLVGKERIYYAHALGVCYLNKAQIAQDEGRPDEAIAHFESAQEQHTISKDTLNSGKAYFLVGQLHCSNGDPEQGFQCYKRALAIFKDLKNLLWMARTTKSVAVLYAQNEQWENAAKAAFAAMLGFEEVKASGDQIEAQLFAVEIRVQLLLYCHRQNVQKQVQEIFKKVPKQLEDSVAAELSAQMDRVHAEIDKIVRADEEIGGFLQAAKELAEKEGSDELLADCYLAESGLRTAKDDAKARKILLKKALDALQEALRKTSVPKRKARLMERIGNLCHDLGRKSEWETWVKRMGEVFEKTGDIYGCADYHGHMAVVHRSNGRLDQQIASYRKVLELIEGRTFHYLSAKARIHLAEAISLKDDFSEALLLLTEAEDICKAHQMKDLISEIATIRSRIEFLVDTIQAASYSLPQLLRSLHQLVRFKPEDATSYLAFWFYAWREELLNLLRSGSSLSLMVVTDDVDLFMSFTVRFSNLADHFALAPTTGTSVTARSKFLVLPPHWHLPSSIPSKQSEDSEDTAARNKNPSEYSNVGLVKVPSPYIFRTNQDGKRAVSVLATPRISAKVVELMLGNPIKDLIQRRAVCFPYLRYSSDDPFLTDLLMGRGWGLFPVYFNSVPTSRDVAVIGSTSIRVSQAFLAEPPPENISKWKRSLLKLTRLPKDKAKVALLDLAGSFPPAKKEGEITITFEVHLYEFQELDQMVIHPVLLFRD
jgi:tetratricopeptide (TPR) repeat protein